MKKTDNRRMQENRMMEMCCCCCCSSNQNKEKEETFAGRKSIAEIACAGRPEQMPAIFLTFFKRNANEQHKNR